MIYAAFFAPLIGAFFTYCRGATIPGSPPRFLNGWLLTITDEPRWTIQRGWLVALIGVWGGAVVWLLVGASGMEPEPWLNYPAEDLDGDQTDWLPIAAAVATWAGAGLAFTLGHGQYQDGGTWAPPPDYVPEDTYLHDVIGMAWTGGAMSLIGAGALALYGLWIPAALVLIGGVAKAAAYMIGWTGIAERVIGPYWLPTRAAEVLQGLFLYAGFSAALLMGGL